MIEIKNLSYKYKTKEKVLDNINLSIKNRRGYCYNSAKMALENLHLQELFQELVCQVKGKF